MAIHKNSEKVLGEYKEAMGEKLGFIMNRLVSEMLTLHELWNSYNVLFNYKRETVDLLNKSAPHLFYQIQNGFKESLISLISRMIDPAKTGKMNYNLSLNYLQEIIDKEEVKVEVELQIKHIIEKLKKPFKDQRNKEISHLDLNVAIKSAKIEEKVTIEVFQLMINAMTDLINSVHEGYGMNKLSFEPLFLNKGAEILIKNLELALSANKYLNRVKKEGKDMLPMEFV